MRICIGFCAACIPNMTSYPFEPFFALFAGLDQVRCHCGLVLQLVILPRKASSLYAYLISSSTAFFTCIKIVEKLEWFRNILSKARASTQLHYSMEKTTPPSRAKILGNIHLLRSTLVGKHAIIGQSPELSLITPNTHVIHFGQKANNDDLNVVVSRCPILFVSPDG